MYVWYFHHSLQFKITATATKNRKNVNINSTAVVLLLSDLLSESVDTNTGIDYVQLYRAGWMAAMLSVANSCLENTSETKSETEGR